MPSFTWAPRQKSEPQRDAVAPPKICTEPARYQPSAPAGVLQPDSHPLENSSRPRASILRATDDPLPGSSSALANPGLHGGALRPQLQRRPPLYRCTSCQLRTRPARSRLHRSLSHRRRPGAQSPLSRRSSTPRPRAHPRRPAERRDLRDSQHVARAGSRSRKQLYPHSCRHSRRPPRCPWLAATRP